MPRIACLLVPDLPVAAACRADPYLAGRPLALSAGTGIHAPIVAAAAAARARGVRAGHTVAQARAIAADLIVRPRGARARLPVAEVARRLGPAGAVLVRTARGEDERPLAPQALGGPLEEAIGLEHALDALEPLLFVLRGLVERVVARVGLEGIGVARLGLALGLDDRSRDERPVPLAAPTRDMKTLLTCLCAKLEARPPRAAVERVVLAAVPRSEERRVGKER